VRIPSTRQQPKLESALCRLLLCAAETKKSDDQVRLSLMDELGEVGLRLRISNLEARLDLVEIGIASLMREIRSTSSYERRVKARNVLDVRRGEQANLLTELDRLRRAYPNIHH
jgi:hypothetical protein